MPNENRICLCTACLNILDNSVRPEALSAGFKGIEHGLGSPDEKNRPTVSDLPMRRALRHHV